MRLDSFHSMFMLSWVIAATITANGICADPPANAPASENDGSLSPVPEQGPVISSDAIPGSKVDLEKSKLHGTIADLMLDLQHGHVSTAIVEFRGMENRKSRMIAVPWKTLFRNPDGSFELRITSDQLERAPELQPHLVGTKATRSWASSVYKHFQSDEREIKRGDRAPDPDGLLTSASTIKDVRVDDLKGAKLGHIAGLAVATRDGRLIYAALELKEGDNKLQAIPLSAFIVKPEKQEWLLDISANALVERPVFPRSAWVKTIDVGWSEYVHVLYGRPVFEGVRSDQKEVESGK